MHRFKVMFTRLMNTLHITSVYAAMLFLAAMTLIISANVFMRYVLNSGLTWAEEVAKLLMVWFTFIAMAAGIKQGLHISLHLLPANLPSGILKILKIIKDLCVLAVALVMLIYGRGLIAFTKQSIMPATQWPGSTLYLILPFAALLIALEAVADILGIDDEASAMDLRFNQSGNNDARL